MKKKLILFLVLLLMLCGCTGKPENKSMNLKREINNKLEAPIDAIFKKWSDQDKKLPGMVVLVAKDGKVVFEKAYGYAYIADADYNAPGSTYANPVYKKIDKPREMKLDTIFDVASVTKAMATTQAIMKLVSEKKVDVNEKVSKYIKGFEKNGKENVTVEQLLTHTSGMPEWDANYFYVNNKKDLLNRLIEMKLDPTFVASDKDKKSVHYSDLGFMLLGYIVESVSGKDLDTYLKENIYGPLGMKRTTFNPLKNGFNKDEIAATSLGNPFEYRMVDEENYPEFSYDMRSAKEVFKKFNGWRKYTLIGEVNDGNAAMASEGVAGSAGLFSTANDLSILAEAMINKGSYNGVTLYDKETVDLFTKQHTKTGEEGWEFGYCFMVDSNWMGDNATSRVFGHQGFTSPTVSMDPDNHLTIIVLTNKMQSGFRNGKDQNPLYYWNVNPMIKEISNAIHAEYKIVKK